MNNPNTFDGGVTEEQIAQWKTQHRKVTRIDVVDGEEQMVGHKLSEFALTRTFKGHAADKKAKK